MENQKEFEALIEKILTEKTFSLEIIETIKSLKEKAAFCEKSLEERDSVVKDLSTKLTEARNNEKNALSELNDARMLLEKIEEKEAKMDKTIYELDFQRNRANEIKELFGVVFKNPMVQKTVFENESKSINGSTYATESNSKSVTESKQVI